METHSYCLVFFYFFRTIFRTIFRIIFRTIFQDFFSSLAIVVMVNITSAEMGVAAGGGSNYFITSPLAVDARGTSEVKAQLRGRETNPPVPVVPVHLGVWQVLALASLWQTSIKSTAVGLAPRSWW